MLKRRQEEIGFLVRVADVLICIVAFFIAYRLRASFYFDHLRPMGAIDSLAWLLVASLVLHFITFPMFGFYYSLRQRSIPQLMLMILKAAAVEFFILGTMVFVLQEKATSRYFLGFFLLLNYSALLVERLGAKLILSSIRRRGYNFRQVLVVGTGRNARQVIQLLKRHPHWGYVPFGVLSEESREKGAEPTIEGVPVIGELKDIDPLVRKRTVDEVYFALDLIDPIKIGSHVTYCEQLGIPARIPLGLFDLTLSKVSFSEVDRLPVITFYTTLMSPMEAFFKRTMDIGVSAVGLMITGLLLPWIAWKIKRESPGPILFKQVRVGENGRSFKCYKFRTMDLDADKRKGELSAKNLMKGPLFKIDKDPRVTRFGRFLRKSSLDELPQFFNILRGDMSVVGTRPPTPDEVLKYETHYRRRLSIRPGLTGLWQVSGRNEINHFEDVLALDLKYIDNWSIWLDLQIIFKTIFVALFRKGAH